MENGAKEQLRILQSMAHCRCARHPITALAPDEVFVFGTDPNGKHKSSAAQLAIAKFGAKIGIAEGLSGQSYAIPVHKFKTDLMVEAVNRFLSFAISNPQLRFHVLPVGCGAAGMDPAFVALMFKRAIDMPNVYLCELFVNELSKYYERLKSASCERIGEVETFSYATNSPPRDKEDLVIGRHWVFIRTADGRLKFVCGKADDDFILKVCGWQNVVHAAAGFDEVFAVLSSGEFISASAREKEYEADLRSEVYRRYSIQSAFKEGYLEWCRSGSLLHGVKSVVACEGRFAAVKFDGSVISVSNRSGYEKPFDYDGQLERTCENGVKKVAVGWLHAAVLDNGGHVTVVGEKEYCDAGAVDDWHDVVDIEVFGCYHSCIQTVGLRADGTVYHTLDCPEIDSWRNVVSVSCLSDRGVVGLDRRGHVLLAGNMPDVSEILKSWPPMAAIKGNYGTLVGVDKGGNLWVSGIKS